MKRALGTSILLKRPKTSGFICSKCRKAFQRQESLIQHDLICRKASIPVLPSTSATLPTGYRQKTSGFNKKLIIYEKELQDTIDHVSLLSQEKPQLETILRQSIRDNKTIKFYVLIYVDFVKTSINETVKTRAYFQSVNRPLFSDDDLETIMSNISNEITDLVENFTQRGSGWTISNIPSIQLAVGSYKPHSGGCSSSTLPDELKNKKCLISMDCDTDCFMYSVLASLYPKNYHKERASLYRDDIEKHDFSSVRGHVATTKISPFERKSGIPINLYSYDKEDKCIVPYRITNIDSSKPVNLFYFKKHYYCISNFNRG